MAGIFSRFRRATIVPMEKFFNVNENDIDEN